MDNGDLDSRIYTLNNFILLFASNKAVTVILLKVVKPFSDHRMMKLPLFFPLRYSCKDSQWNDVDDHIFPPK